MVDRDVSIHYDQKMGVSACSLALSCVMLKNLNCRSMRYIQHAQSLGDNCTCPEPCRYLSRFKEYRIWTEQGDLGGPAFCMRVKPRTGKVGAGKVYQALSIPMQCSWLKAAPHWSSRLVRRCAMRLHTTQHMLYAPMNSPVDQIEAHPPTRSSSSCPY